MALIKCPDCKNEISNVAKTCPNCGYPLEEQTKAKARARAAELEAKRKKKKRMITWGIILALVIAGAISNALKSPEEKAASQNVTPRTEQKDPCANIKDMADWEKASTLWRNSHPECKPQQ